MIFSRKRGARRMEIRKNRPDTGARWLANMRADGSLATFWVAVGFFIATAAVMSLRQSVIPYRPGQYAAHDIVSRVEFTYHDRDKLEEKKRIARELEPRVYVATEPDQWEQLQKMLTELPQQVANVREDELPASLKSIIDSATLNKLQEYAEPARKNGYEESVKAYIAEIRKLDPVILPAEQRAKDRGRMISIPGRSGVYADATYSLDNPTDLAAKLRSIAGGQFLASFGSKISQLTLANLKPTHTFNEQATIAAQNVATTRLPESEGNLLFKANGRYR